MAVTDLGRVCPAPKGIYSDSLLYEKLDIVSYLGDSYSANQDLPTVDILPTNTTYWTCLVASDGPGIILTMYPVGTIYTSVVSTNPGTLFGGTWAPFGAGRVLVGLDSGDTDFDTAEKTGGAKAVANTLSGAGYAKLSSAGKSQVVIVDSYVTDYTEADYAPNTAASTATTGIELGGATDAGSVVQPYITVYFFKRVS